MSNYVERANDIVRAPARESRFRRKRNPPAAVCGWECYEQGKAQTLARLRRRFGLGLAALNLRTALKLRAAECAQFCAHHQTLPIATEY